MDALKSVLQVWADLGLSAAAGVLLGTMVVALVGFAFAVLWIVA